MNAHNCALLQLQTDPLQTRLGVIDGDKGRNRRKLNPSTCVPTIKDVAK